MSFLSSLKTGAQSASVKTGSILRYILMKALGIFLAVVFFSLAVLFLGYGLIAVVTASSKAKEAKVTVVSETVGGHHVACRVGGLFEIQTESGKGKDLEKDSKIYSLYPAWPDKLSPSSGDWVRVWPMKKPLVAFPGVDGWAWFIVGTIVILGFLSLEFAFLSVLLK